MSNTTFNMSTDKDEGTLPPSRREALSPESQYSNSSLSPSPDSNSSISNLSETEASSSPDINMLECCLSVSSAVSNPFSTSAPQNNVFCDVNMNLNQTFIATPVNSSANFWNENLSVMSNHEMGSEKYQTFSKKTEDGSKSMVTSPDSAGRESRLSSDQTSRRGSTENDCCSLSSGEMVLRSNSFCLEDQSLLVSSLDESSHPALPADSNLLSTTLPDVFEKSTERVSEENSCHQCLGMTFTHAAFPSVENDMATSNSLVSLPSEHEGGLLMTFVCETSPTDCGIEAQFSTAGAQPLPHSPVAFIPEQDKTFMDPLSSTQHTNKVIHTSTPVQNNGNAMPSLPSFSESPCMSLHPVKAQQISVSPNCLVLGLPPSAAKVKKMEIKKFPKSDFSSVKSKVVTRGGHQISVSGPAAQHKPPQVNINNVEGRTVRISPAKLRSSTAVSTTKTVTDAQRRVSAGTAHLGVPLTPSSGQTAVDGQGKSGASPPNPHPAASKNAPVVQCSNGSSETEQVASSQVADATEQHSSSQNLCLSSFQKSPGQTDPKSSPKKDVLNKIEVRSGSALGQDKPSVLKARPRCSSDSLSSRPSREKRAPVRFSASFTLPKGDSYLGQTKPGNLNKQATQTEATNRPAGSSTREVKRISLVAESSKSTTAAASWDESKSKFRGRPSPRQTRAVLTAASPRPATLSTRPRQGTQGRDESRTRTVGTPQAKQRSSTGSQRVQTGEPSLGAASTASIKPQLNGSRPPHTPTRTPLMGPPSTPSSRLPRKPPGPSRNLMEHMTEAAGSKQVYGGAANKPSPLRSVVLKTRLTTTPGKTTGPSLTTACKPAAPTSKGTLNSTVSHLKRTASAGLARLTPSGPVDKNKPKVGSRQQQPQHQASQLNQRNGPPDVVPASSAEGGRKDPSIQQLRGLLAASNCRFEAAAIVLQQCLAERDEATKQCRDLSQELANLRGELVCSLRSSECLEKEKDELRVALEDALLKLQQQHQKDLAELEQRLQTFYQAEWDKVHLSYQEEADKCKAVMQQQMGELKANHEAMKLELESSHAEQLQSVKQQYETSLEELNRVHSEELQSLGKTLKETGAALSGQIEALTVENNGLIEKLTAEENRRKQLAEQSQKDSHTLYLEQELESLKVVLDIKNKQLHQQEKKLMEVDKLMEKNVKLDESLKKVQQENEDLKARMERHYALSRQLSTEQAVLQESLQKESKVNKRLSMENEELMWKLHNGDLSSPRMVSPTSTSPSRSFSLQSPRSSGMVSSPPMSPR